MHNMNFNTVSSAAVESALGRRIEEIRLSRNIPQRRLAKEAGVSRSTITRLSQDGKGVSLDSFIRIMQALGLSHHLEALLPDPSIRPVERVQRDGGQRRRARESKNVGRSEWAWDEPTSKS
jgi:putative transcriptional regulator